MAVETQIHAVAEEVERHRLRSPDRCTRVVPTRRRHPDVARALFEFHRSVLEDFAAPHLEEGFLVAAASDEALLGIVWCKAGPRPRVVTLGRHSACDVSLPTDDDTPLRQVVVLVRQTDDGRPHARVFDLTRLRSGISGLAGGHGLLCSGEHAIFVIPTAAGRLSSGWKQALLEEKTASGAELRFSDGVSVFVSGERLRAGVLLGRYGCCVAHQHFDDLATSRIHALLVRDGGEVVLLDAGSTNGLVVNGERCCARILCAGDQVRLGQKTFDWLPREEGCFALLPAGVEHALALARRSGDHAVFADWLLDRGSQWGEWIAAEVAGAAERAAVLKETLEPRLLGPLAALQARRWDRGVLVEATLAESLDARACGWPLWAGLERLRVASARRDEAARLPLCPSVVEVTP